MAMDMSKLGKGVQIAEEQRDKRRHEGFMADLFRGKAKFELFSSCQSFETADEKREGEKMLAKLRHFLMTEVDPQNVEETDRISNRALEWLCENGFFGLKIPTEYGGKNLSQSDYMRLMSLTASYCGALVALLSASNSIGLGWPLKGYGTDAQKKKYLPTVASNPSGFSFTTTNKESLLNMTKEWSPYSRLMDHYRYVFPMYTTLSFISGVLNILSIRLSILSSSNTGTHISLSKKLPASRLPNFTSYLPTLLKCLVLRHQPRIGFHKSLI